MKAKVSKINLLMLTALLSVAILFASACRNDPRELDELYIVFGSMEYYSEISQSHKPKYCLLIPNSNEPLKSVTISVFNDVNENSKDDDGENIWRSTCTDCTKMSAGWLATSLPGSPPTLRYSYKLLHQDGTETEGGDKISFE